MANLQSLNRLSRLSLRFRIFLFFLLLGIAVPLVMGGLIWLVGSAIEEKGVAELWGLLVVYCGGAGIIIMLLVVIVGLLFDINLAAPIQGLIRDIQTVVHANPRHRIEVENAKHLGLLPQVTLDMAFQLARSRKETARLVADATASMEEQKSQLEALLRDLHEGVVLCNFNHRILLYNQRAISLLHVSGEIGLGRPLFSLMNSEPVLHALDRLTNRIREDRHTSHVQGLAVPFICATADSKFILQSQMSLVLDADEQPTGYVVTFSDMTEELKALGERDSLLRRATEGLRAPVANLRAASETLNNFPDIDSTSHRAFEEVIFNESKNLSDAVNGLAEEYRSVIVGSWPMNDIYSANLLTLVTRRFEKSKKLNVVMTGMPVWLHADSHSLVEAIEHLVKKLAKATDAKSFDLEAAPSEGRVNLDIIWKGAPVPSSKLNKWKGNKLEKALGGLALKDVLEHHKSEIWSYDLQDGTACLRMPLPQARQPELVRRSKKWAKPPPEFYDFELMHQHDPSGELGEQKLKDLTFVVFDTETTGLKPSDGDAMISIAGVRIVNGRILTGESFSRLINPGRSIPEESITFHGISEEMIKDKPPVQVVLPQFHEFVKDAVLVAHNAAFDMKFISLVEEECGLSFENPVLDSLLLSAFLHDHSTDHTLDAAAERFGVEVHGRHTALGDSLVTAAVFLGMIDMLEGRGVTTLNEAISATKKVIEVRRQQKKF